LITFQPLPRSFYSPSAKTVASQLLGHFLLRNTGRGVAGGAIVEAEAYLKDDPACHSFRGETARNRSMFGPPGHAYVYLIYGYHFCMNAVCQPAGCGEAVLIRAIAVDFGEDWMQQRREVHKREELTKGPAKLCQALAIDRKLDGVDLCDSASPLFIAANPNRTELLLKSGPIVATRRIGISKSVDLPLRFYLRESPFVSRRIDRA
jgi:DNA-3-methyladenine glycosylase